MDFPDLERFKTAQEHSYLTALSEIKNGRKESHWIWYIFPQIKGLGRSSMALHYAIQSIDEAIAYLDDPLLGRNLLEITDVLFNLKETDAYKIFGGIDTIKLRSCMTLFAQITGSNSIFHKVLEKYFNGEPDIATLQILDNDK